VLMIMAGCPKKKCLLSYHIFWSS